MRLTGPWPTSRSSPSRANPEKGPPRRLGGAWDDSPEWAYLGFLPNRLREILAIGGFEIRAHRPQLARSRLAPDHRRSQVEAPRRVGHETTWYLFCRGARHSVGNAQQQFLPHAIEWVWKGYAPKTEK